MRPIDGDKVLDQIEERIKDCKDRKEFDCDGKAYKIVFLEGEIQAFRAIKTFIEDLPVLTTALDYMDDGR